MQVEYRISFRADGVTVSQIVQPDAGWNPGAAVAAPESTTTALPQAPATTGFALPGQPALPGALGGGDEEAGVGDTTPHAGPLDKTDPGGGRAVQPAVILSCPIIVVYPGAKSAR